MVPQRLHAPNCSSVGPCEFGVQRTLQVGLRAFRDAESFPKLRVQMPSPTTKPTLDLGNIAFHRREYIPCDREYRR